MSVQGFAEEAEATAKWRRLELTHGQLTSYFVGWQQIEGLVADLRRLNPGWTQQRVHDTMLAHGCVRPSALRQLVGLS